MSHQPNHILLTIDVEDWFQVENFKQYIPFSSWSSCELRVEKNTHHLLDLLDSYTLEQPEDFHRRRIDSSQFHPRPPRKRERCGQEETEKRKESNKSCLPCGMQSIFHRGKSCQTYKGTPKATFFVLGWIAERLPQLVRNQV